MMCGSFGKCGRFGKCTNAATKVAIQDPSVSGDFFPVYYCDHHGDEVANAISTSVSKTLYIGVVSVEEFEILKIKARL